MKKRKYLATAVSLLLSAVMLSGCSHMGGADSSDAGQSATSTDAQNGSSASSESLSKNEMFTSRDMEIGYDEETAAAIKLTGSSAECASDAVKISNGTVTIKDEGTYIISGKLSDGSVVVDAGKSDKVQLVLNGAEITSGSSAAVYVKKADKVFITLASNTENTLTSSGEFVAVDDNNIDAAVFSKDDITLNGLGKLNISCSAGHGVVSKNNLVITSGTYNINAAKQGLSAKDSVRIADGTVTVTSGKDGIKAENSNDTSKGFVYIACGSFDITSEGDGISAGSYAQIDEGNFKITAGKSAAPGSTTSTKGIKAAGNLTVSGGTFVIDSADDSVHSNSDITLSGGKYTLATGDDGVHADNTLTVSGGEIDITKSYEGLEGLTVNITGGKITVKATDDGINAAGGKDESGFGGNRGKDAFGADSNAAINISGGTVNVNASGDGIDSNGNLTVSGGYVYISGPSNGGNGALDYDGEGNITGGTVVAAGASRMAMNFSSSTQGSILVTFDNQKANTLIKLTDSSGNVLITYTAENSFDSVVLSCPEIKQGEKYTVTVGDITQEVTMDKLIYGETSDFGGGFGGGNGQMRDPGNAPDFDNSGSFERPDFPSGQTPPDGQEPPEKPDGSDSDGDRKMPPWDRGDPNGRDNQSSSTSQG